MATRSTLLHISLLIFTAQCILKPALARPDRSVGGAATALKALGAFGSQQRSEDAPEKLREGRALEGTQSSPKVCGLRRSAMPDIFTRIVGGANADRHEFPWQASLQWRFGNYSYHVCAATVLSARWLLTAAHCTKQLRRQEMRVVAGEHELGVGEAGEQERGVAEVAEHYSYSASTQEHDIALLKVDRPFSMNGFSLLPACLPYPDQDFTGECLVTGWGKLKENGRSEKVLRKVVAPILTRKSCEQNYKDVGYTGPISESMFCAGYSQGHKDACQADSGGPLVCRGPADRYVLAGIVSWGIGCSRPGVPGVYTEVAHYIDWIRSVVSGSSVFTPRAVGQQTSMHLDDIGNATQQHTQQHTQQVEAEVVEAEVEYEEDSHPDHEDLAQATFPPSIFHKQTEDASEDTQESQSTNEFDEDYNAGNLDDIHGILYGNLRTNGAESSFSYH